MFVKLFDRLLKSSLMDADLATRWAWVALLLQSDAAGNVYGTIPALARAANIAPEQMRAAMDVFTAPDPDSTTPDDDGRRVLNVSPNQWLIVNYERYRATKDADTAREQTRKRVQEHRRKCRERAEIVGCNAGVTQCNARKRHTEAEAEAEVDQVSVATQPHPSSPDGADLGAADGQAEQGDIREGRDKGQDKAKCKPATPDTPVTRIFAHWQEVMGHPGAKLDPKRTGAIRRALRLGYTEQALIRAIDGCRLTPYNMGDNEQGRKYDALDLILRDAEHIDRFIAHADNPPRPRGKVHPESITAQRAREAHRPRAPVITYVPKPRRADDPF